MPTNIAVLGAGAIGLSTALRLLEDSKARGRAVTVTIVARDYPMPAETQLLDPAAHLDYASAWAGAHNRWVPWVADGSEEAAVAAREHSFALATFRHMMATATAFGSETGILFLPGIEYVDVPGPAYTQLADVAVQQRLGLRDLDLALDFRLLDPNVDVLPAGVAWGCTYRTWCVHPMVYCAFLLRRIVAAGGRLVRRTLHVPHELLTTHDIVVNCSGHGFGDDPHTFITRGQTCLVRNPCAATVTRQCADGSWSFCVPRTCAGGTVVGGTRDVANWDPAPSPVTRDRLLCAFAATYPPIVDATFPGGFDVVADIVGRRPTRHGGMRLDVEVEPSATPATRPKAIVHAYGLGGRGYELSWGVAVAAADLVWQTLDARPPTAAL